MLESHIIFIDFAAVNIGFIHPSFTTIKQKPDLKTSPYSNLETVLKPVFYITHTLLQENMHMYRAGRNHLGMDERVKNIMGNKKAVKLKECS